jgi:hypothetical protein
MRQTTSALAALACGTVLAAAASGQTWTVALAPPGQVAQTNLRTDAVNIVTQPQATVAVSCTSGVDCTTVTLRLSGGPAGTVDLTPAAGATASAASLQVPKAQVANGSALALRLAGNPLASFPVGPDSGSTGGPPAGGGSTGGGTAGGGTGGGSGSSGGSDGATLAQLLAIQCPGTFSATYDAAKNLGAIVVTPLGVVLASRLDTQFDENDTLEVHVVAHVQLLPLLTVERTSAFRDATAINILGAGEAVPNLARQAGLVAECDERTFLLENFAPGQAKVAIKALQGTQLTTVGTFDFNVNPLYTGMLTLGGARTDLFGGGFDLATVGGNSVIAANETGDDDLVYTLFYTPFVWGKRDVQKRLSWYHHVNPTVGVAPEDPAENAFVGITVDLPAGFALTYGRHFGEIEVLTQGVSVGDTFSGTADEIPTAKEWKNDAFWAVSIDLRAMAKVLRAALGTSSGGSGGGS